MSVAMVRCPFKKRNGFQEEMTLRIVEPVWSVLPMPPSQKQAAEPLHTHKKAEKMFLAIFQEVADRRCFRLPFLGGRKPRNKHRIK